MRGARQDVSHETELISYLTTSRVVASTRPGTARLKHLFRGVSFRFQDIAGGRVLRQSLAKFHLSAQNFSTADVTELTIAF
jgi:hypothetical protein